MKPGSAAPSQVRISLGQSCSSPPSCGMTIRPRPNTRRFRHQPRQARTRLRRPLSDSLARAGKGLFVETWAAFEQILASGRTRAIGVSNFLPEHLELLAEHSSITPGRQPDRIAPQTATARVTGVRAKSRHRNRAWSPLGQGTILDDPAIGKIAAAQGKSPAQIILRWHLEQGHTVLSKSVTPARMRDNAAIFDFALDADESAAIAALNTDSRVGPDPVELN